MNTYFKTHAFQGNHHIYLIESVDFKYIYLKGPEKFIKELLLVARLLYYTATTTNIS